MEHYEPGLWIQFRFHRPVGFDGTHSFHLLFDEHDCPILEHRVTMKARGWARLSWPLIIGPLHNALLEDALTKAEKNLGLKEQPVAWTPWVQGVRSLTLDRSPKLMTKLGSN